MNKNKSLFVALALALLFSACKREPKIPNEQEVITTLVYTLTPSGGGTTATFTFRDVDGDGGNNPVLTTTNLQANTTYAGAVVLTNEQASPTEDVTAEISEEEDEHQFFFSSTVTGLSVAYNDRDSNNKPIGLATTLTTTDAGTGQLTIILRHEPDKTAANVSSGDITNAGGATDIEVTFDVTVE